MKSINYEGVFMVQKEAKITFRLDPKSLEAVERKAAETGETKSNVIRLAIIEYITNYKEIEKEQPKVERIAIRLEEDYRKKLNDISDKTGKSISELVREAINLSLLDKITVPIPRKLLMGVRRLIEKEKQLRLDDGMQKSLDDY